MKQIRLEIHLEAGGVSPAEHGELRPTSEAPDGRRVEQFAEARHEKRRILALGQDADTFGVADVQVQHRLGLARCVSCRPKYDLPTRSHL